LAETGWLALPPPIVVVRGVVARLAPLPGAVKITWPPSTGSLKVLLTVATSGAAKAVLIRVPCPLPPVALRTKPRDSKAPMSAVAPWGRAMPR
jgi:hypothetical protein